ncbi:AcrR family transcriptional regulator [Naumannella cuiyingiana]|uniref:AcrR family transcriptional regulator n=1 Tax=Naumannella cuiyingiana TaxID=1347891 RepID=A0A7Z0D5Z6_9ACTN|nr:TetR family transcriptional regulator C-terminal domain-containing protein [Naumannella cuiyingiana]NYI69488.1 AcrR family transcriptional regulator [Naumannella cuiyingiana]
MARVDHQQRRREIAEAVWRLLENGGVESASVRGVIAETGLSSGSIRFFFSTQAGLHQFAMASLAERVRERVRGATAEPDPSARALAMASELMPLRDDTERELSVWMAFVAKARHDPELARIVAEQATAIREFLAKLLSDLVALGLRAPGTDTGTDVAHLNAVIDGLTLELLTVPELIDRDQAAALLRRALLPGEEPTRKEENA